MFLEESATDELQALAVKAVYSLRTFIAKECQPMNEAAKMLEARVIAAEDRLLLKLHYWDGFSIAAISPLLGRPQRELYSARNKCLQKIRRNLEEAGLSSEQVKALLGCSHLDLTEEL
jgi:hypothetical protein